MQILSDSLFQYTSNHNQFDTLYCRVSIFWNRFESNKYIRPDGKAVYGARLESQGLLVRFPEETFFSFWKFCLFPFFAARRNHANGIKRSHLHVVNVVL